MIANRVVGPSGTILLALLAAGVVAPAFAQPATPSWATRNGNGELVIDAGQDFGTVTVRNPAQMEWGQRSFAPLQSSPDCRTCSPDDEVFDAVIWSSVLDHRESNGAFSPNRCGADILQWSNQKRARHIFVKDSILRNAWRAPGMPTATNPNKDCISHHTDLFQMYWIGQAGGWVVLQDSFVINGDTSIIQVTTTGDKHGSGSNLHAFDNTQAPSSLGKGTGGFLIQGVAMGNESAATGDVDGDGFADYVDTCLSRGQTNCQGNQVNIRADQGGCPGGRCQQIPYVWLVEVDKISPFAWNIGTASNGTTDPGNTTEDVKRLIVVGGSGGSSDCTGCWDNDPNLAICGSWTSSRCGHGPGSGTIEEMYYFDTLDDALAYSQSTGKNWVEPPFARLSETGWSGSTELSPPTAPVLTPPQ